MSDTVGGEIHMLTCSHCDSLSVTNEVLAKVHEVDIPGSPECLAFLREDYWELSLGYSCL